MMASKNSDKKKLLQTELALNYGTLISASEIKKKQEKEIVLGTSIFNLFIYSTKLDRTLIVIGIILAFLSGSMMPLLGLFFGGMTNTFLNVAVNGLVPDEVVHTAMSQAVKNMTPIMIIYNTSTPMHLQKNNDKLLFQVVYKITEIFSTKNPYADLSNDTFTTPLTESQFEESLMKYSIIYLIIGILMLLFSFLQTLCWEYTSEHQVYTIRQKYFSQILRQDISWYDTNDNGNLPNKLSDDVERIREGTGYKCAMIIQYISTFITGILVGFSVSWQLTLAILCVAPFLIGMSTYAYKFGATSTAREQEKYAAAGAVAEEVLSNIKTVNAFGGQVREVKRYNYWLEEGRKLAMKKYNMLSICLAFMFFFMYGAYGIGFSYGSYLVELGITSPGSIFTIFFSVVAGSASVGHALPFLNFVSNSIGVISSVHNIIVRKSVIDPYSTTGRKLLHTSGRIEFRNVSFAYPTRPQSPVLNGLNLTIEPGSQVALVGSSGAGKSTIVSLILRFYDTTSGEIYLDNIAVRDYNVRWLRSQIGLVSQEPVLFGVSIAENIKYGSEYATDEDIIEAAKQANAHDFIIMLPQGYDTLVGDTGSQLSGGQKQRIAIARALVRNPKILLLDEATSALDANSEGIVQDTLEKAMKGRTTVIVAHRLSTVRHADRICVMQNGQIVESGTHEELMAKGSIYYSLVQAQLAKETEELSDFSGDSNKELSMVNESNGEEYPVSSNEESSIGNETFVDADSELAQRNEDVTIYIQETDSNKEILETEKQNNKFKQATETKKAEYTATSTFTRQENLVSDKEDEAEPNYRVLDRQVSSKVLTDEDDSDEYETIVTKISETREILFDDEGDENKQYLKSEDKSGKAIGMQELDSKDQNLSSKRKHSKNVSEISEGEKKNIHFLKPEKIEKEMTLLQLLKMQKPEWLWLLIGIIGFIITGSITPTFALYYGEIFKVFTLNGIALLKARMFWTYMFVALALVSGLAFSIQTKGMTEANEKLITRARSLVFQNILKQPVGWFDLDTSSPGILVNRLARNAPLVKAAAGMRAGQVLSATVTLLGAFTVAFICGWKLASALIVAVPIIIFMTIKQHQILNRNINRDTKSMDKAGKVASETVRNIRTVQALGQEKLFTEMYTKNLEEPYKEGKKQSFLFSLLYGLTQGIMYSMYAIAFRLGGYLVEKQEMSIDEIFKVFFALSLCANSVGNMFSYIQDYAKARYSIRLLNYLLSRKSEIDSSLLTGAKPEIKGKVEFKQVYFSYPTRPKIKVLKGLSFTVTEGKTLALVGESGCGKSTIISLLERFYDPIAGEITVDGYDIRALNLNHLRSKIGIVTQEPILFDTTIRENIAYGVISLQDEVSFDQIEQAARAANIHDFIMTLPDRYNTMVGERGVQLSGGQKQRVAIARALIRNPKILLLDEATSALDSENEKIVQAALDKAKQGRTCIVVAHRLSTVQNADTICVVYKGKIAESGTHDELQARKGLYFQLTQRQSLQ